jgi:hypothetical protein
MPSINPPFSVIVEFESKSLFLILTLDEFIQTQLLFSSLEKENNLVQGQDVD